MIFLFLLGVVTIGPNLPPSHHSNPLNTLNIFASAQSLLQRFFITMVMVILKLYLIFVICGLTMFCHHEALSMIACLVNYVFTLGLSTT